LKTGLNISKNKKGKDTFLVALFQLFLLK